MLRPKLPTRARTFFPVAALAALLTLVGLVSLPHNDYVRFNSLTDKEVVKLGWIYERLHFDTTPIDVVFVGSSHTLFGVDSEQVEKSALESGTALNVVNFGLAHLGRNMQWLLAKEAIETRSLRMIVIELQYDESRALHPAFFAVAKAADVIQAPVIINTSFASDIARLPARQASLFLRSVMPGVIGAQTKFQASLYRGAHWDDTYVERGSLAHPLKDIPPRIHGLKPEKIDAERASWERLRSSKLKLPQRITFLETRANFQYLTAIVDLAHARGVQVRFVYLPTYGDPSTPENAAFYAGLASTWGPPAEVFAPLAHWHDINHLNYSGALALSSWTGRQLAKDLSNRLE